MFEQLVDLSSYFCLKLIQKVGRGGIKGVMKKTPVLGLNGDMNLEGDYGNGGDMKPEGASGDGDGDNIEFNNGSVSLQIQKWFYQLDKKA